MTLLFWLSAGLVVYVYLGYPLLLIIWSRARRLGLKGRAADIAAFAPADGDLPRVSIVIAARNEAGRLARRLDNLLSLDFPAARRQIIVALDGSTDDSQQVLKRYASDVDVVMVPVRGKAAALNAGVALARHEILVFADARQTFAHDALRQLVAPFADARIGGVTGELVLDAETMLFADRRKQPDRRRSARPGSANRRRVSSTIGDGLGLYWRYEKALRRLESSIWSTLGATGAIYAIRREYWTDLPAGTILDDVLVPMRVVMQGRRVVFNEGARAFDRAAGDADAEARRKVRTLAGNFQLLTLEPRLLLPWRNPVWLQFMSHKLGRLAVPYALLAVFAASIALSAEVFYLLVLCVQVAFYLLAGYGAWLEARARAAAPTRSAAGALVREVA